MTRSFVPLTMALALAVAGGTIGGRAQAAAIAPAGLRTAADEAVIVDKIQFVFRGRRYCWYATGWRGPGWYWCGYRWRRGLGWGGPVGWRGWRRPGHRPGIRPPHRPGIRPPGVRPPHRPGIRPPIGHVPGNRPGGHRPGGHRPGGHRPGGNTSGAHRPGGSGPGGNRRSGGNG
jgi:hypothetical protein